VIQPANSTGLPILSRSHGLISISVPCAEPPTQVSLGESLAVALIYRGVTWGHVLAGRVQIRQIT
jgi:hypothetical protein